MNRNYKICIFLVLIAVVSIFCPVYAAQAEKATSSSAGHDWTGIYTGIHFGYGWDIGNTKVEALPTAAIFVNLQNTKIEPDVNGIFGGAQLGYNWQKNIFVLGIETDFSASGISGTKTISPITQDNGTPYPGAGNNISLKEKIDWFGTLRLRAGITPIKKLLLYGTGGMAYAHIKTMTNTDFRPIGTEQYRGSSNETKIGWTAGAGAEYALTKNWSIKTEYLYYDLGSQSNTANPSIPFPPGAPNYQVKYEWETSAHTVNIGLNYKF